MTKTFLRDLLERAVKTFVQGFIGVLLLSNLGTTGVDALSVLQTAGLAGIMAALSVVSSALSAAVGNTNSASVVVSTPPPPLATIVSNTVLNSPPPQQAAADYSTGTPDELARAIRHSSVTAPDPKDAPNG